MQLATFDLRDLNAGFQTFPVVDLVKTPLPLLSEYYWTHRCDFIDRNQFEIWTELSASRRRQRYRYVVC